MPVNPLALPEEKLKNKIKELEEEIKQLEGMNYNYASCVQAIKDFCADCPMKEDAIRCHDCYLFECKNVDEVE